MQTLLVVLLIGLVVAAVRAPDPCCQRIGTYHVLALAQRMAYRFGALEDRSRDLHSVFTVFQDAHANMSARMRQQEWQMAELHALLLRLDSRLQAVAAEREQLTQRVRLLEGNVAQAQRFRRHHNEKGPLQDLTFDLQKTRGDSASPEVQSSGDIHVQNDANSRQEEEIVFAQVDFVNSAGAEVHNSGDTIGKGEINGERENSSWQNLNSTQNGNQDAEHGFVQGNPPNSTDEKEMVANREYDGHFRDNLHTDLKLVNDAPQQVLLEKHNVNHTSVHAQTSAGGSQHSVKINNGERGSHFWNNYHMDLSGVQTAQQAFIQKKHHNHTGEKPHSSSGIVDAPLSKNGDIGNVEESLTHEDMRHKHSLNTAPMTRQNNTASVDVKLPPGEDTSDFLQVEKSVEVTEDSFIKSNESVFSGKDKSIEGTHWQRPRKDLTTIQENESTLFTLEIPLSIVDDTSASEQVDPKSEDGFTVVPQSEYEEDVKENGVLNVTNDNVTLHHDGEKTMDSHPLNNTAAETSAGVQVDVFLTEFNQTGNEIKGLPNMTDLLDVTHGVHQLPSLAANVTGSPESAEVKYQIVRNKSESNESVQVGQLLCNRSKTEYNNATESDVPCAQGSDQNTTECCHDGISTADQQEDTFDVEANLRRLEELIMLLSQNGSNSTEPPAVVHSACVALAEENVMLQHALGLAVELLAKTAEACQRWVEMATTAVENAVDDF